MSGAIMLESPRAISQEAAVLFAQPSLDIR
jgi:hypothetical protein